MWSSLQKLTLSQVFGVIFGLVFLLYLPTFGNDFLWDDEQFIVKNIFTSSLRYLPQILTTNTIAGAGHVSNYYRPLTTLSFTLDRMVWGLNPFGFHLTNTWLHAAVAGLFTIVLVRLGFSKLQALGLGLIYGFHPLNTEAVTYINSRGDSLFAFWLLVGLLAFDSAVSKKEWHFSYDGHRYEVNQAWLWIVAGTSFGAAVLAKEIAVAGIGIFFLVAGWHWWQRVIDRQKTSIFLGTLCFQLAIYFGLRLTVLNFSNSLNFYTFENEYTRSLVVRIFTFCRVLWEYIRLLIMPYPLHMERSVEFVTQWSSPWVWMTIIGLGIWGGLSYWEMKKRNSGLIALGGLWFLGLLVPVSGIVPINGIMYEHWLYVPMMGFLIAGGGLWRLLQPAIPPLFGRVLLMLVGVIFAVLTLRQNWIWRHPIPFYTYTLQYAQSARLYNNLAMAYADEGETQKSIEIYQQALTQSNVYPQIYYNLARSYLELGERDRSVQSAEKAVEVDPGFFFARMFLVELYLANEEYTAALPHLEHLVAADPADPILRQALLDTQQRAEPERENKQ